MTNERMVMVITKRDRCERRWMKCSHGMQEEEERKKKECMMAIEGINYFVYRNRF